MRRINLLERVREYLGEAQSARRAGSELFQAADCLRRAPVSPDESQEMRRVLYPRLGSPRPAVGTPLGDWISTLGPGEWSRMVEAGVPLSMVDHAEMWVVLAHLLGDLGVAAMAVSDFVLERRWRGVLSRCGDSAAACIGGCVSARNRALREPGLDPDDPALIVGGYLPASTKDTVATLVDLARDGDRETFVEIAAMNGVKRDRLEELWAGTRTRLARATAPQGQGETA